MKPLRFLILLSLVTCSISCEREKYYKNSDITIGNYSNMIVTSYDTILVGGYHYEQYLDIDIDNDGENDIRLISEVWGSPGLGQNPCSKIWSLNDNVRLNGYHANDTTFLNRSTRIIDGPNNTTEIYEYYNITCHQIEGSDSILNIHHDVFKLLPKDYGNPLSLKDTFQADSITMIDDWYGYPTKMHISGDTTLYEYYSFYNNCHSFPLDVIKYIGIKTGYKGESRLGWIKLSVIDKYKVVLLESAIQE